MSLSQLAFDALAAGAGAATLAALAQFLAPRARTAAQRHDAHFAVVLSALAGLCASPVVPKLGLAWLPAPPLPEPGSPALLADVAPLPWGWLAYAIVACACLARRLAADAQVRRLARAAPPLEARVWSAILADLREQLGIRAQVQLVTHPGLAGGATFGILRPIVALSEDARRGPTGRWRAVLLHELAHVRRRDVLASWIADLACALFWFLPWVWRARARMRAEREVACDDRVIALGARPSSYGAVLVDLLRRQRALAVAGGGWLGAGALARAAGEQPASEFEQRFVALLRPRGIEAAPGARRSGQLAPACCAAALLAMLQLAPAAVEPPVPEFAVAALPAAVGAAPMAPAPSIAETSTAGSNLAEASTPAPSMAAAGAPAPNLGEHGPAGIAHAPGAAPRVASEPAPRPAESALPAVGSEPGAAPEAPAVPARAPSRAVPARGRLAVVPFGPGAPRRALGPELDGIVSEALEAARDRAGARGPLSVFVIQARIPLGASSR